MGYSTVNERLAILNMADVFDKVSEKLGLSFEGVTGKSRKREFADARKIGIKVCLDILNYDRHIDGGKLGYSAIGIFLNVGHSDIIHLATKCEDYISTNKEFRSKYEKCKDVKHEFIKKFTEKKAQIKRDELLITN